MLPKDPVVWGSIIMPPLLMVVGSVSFKNYRRTNVEDFLIWAGFFFLVAVYTFFRFLALTTQILFFFKCYYWLLCCAWFLAFLFGVRMRWERAPPIVWYIGVIWPSILIFLISFLEPMQEPARAVVLFWEMPHGYSEFYPDGVGIMTKGGVIFLATAYNILIHGFVIYAVGLWVYTHLTTPLPYSSNRTKLAHRLYIIVGILAIIGFLLYLPGFSIFWGFNEILFVIAVGIVTYISIWLPEGLLLSQIQLIRAVELYKQIRNLTPEDAIQKFGMPSLVEYMQTIPPEILTQTNE